MLSNLVNYINDIEINLKEQDILDLLQIEKRWPISYPSSQSSVEIINNLGHNSRSGIFNQEGYLDYIKWKHLYDLGYTTIISNILDIHKDLRDLNAYIQRKLGSKINGNFYFSQPGQLPSFEPHAHEYHVIVKQIYGKSEWINGDKQLTLEPQKAILIPMRTVHQVITKHEKKLSLTLNIQ
jgi:mannose-6-phosphate isomerase-like protein (cupin superfamily)